jgi:class 3 adenylate cyclase/tetratricopeptide (TPR) repeat protein
MKVCAACGVENPEIARFCLACGTQLAEARPPQETRKVVTIVFSDLKGSTSLGEALDSEALREVMTRYFDAMRGELERHGGVVEKFIGDAVMAVFGLPRLHEDDALRAVRAAAGMQAALEALNDELQLVYGVQLANRTGVNTGEVVSGDPTSGQRLVTGDAVNVAARLEQAAGEREVLLGELTYRLVRDSVDVREVEPLELKGKSEPVSAFRLVGVREASDVPARRAAPLVGREAELAVLESALDDASSSRSLRLVTVVGDAGVGKSRLTAEFLAASTSRALSLTGRCLPYGDGITFWPVAEAVKGLAGIVNDDSAMEVRAKLAALSDQAGEDVTARLASALGVSVEPFPVEELFWAVRRLLTHLAADRPVIFVIEDIHWAEPTMLALIEHLVQACDAPVLLVCPTRPELLEETRDWSTGERATRVVLDPLGTDDSKSLIEGLLGEGTLDAAVLDHVVTASEGNPLFAEQLLRMLVDEQVVELDDGTWRFTQERSEIHVPPTIQALLASRLDTLQPSERSVIEPASVVGYVFPEDAVVALTPPDVSPRVGMELTTLAQKHLVRRIEDGGDGAHRFHHIMIRDTAYDGILKRARADLHTRFVAWADLANRDRQVEFEEILGYHLEQAWTYLSELGPLDERGREIGEEGARRLASAGRRAFARGDVPAAAGLLGRAAALLPSDHRARLAVLPEYGEALLMTGRFEEASAVLEDAIGHGTVAPTAAARARLVRLLVRLRTGAADGWGEGANNEIASTIEVFGAERDEAGLAMGWRLHAWAAGTAGRFADAAEAARHAVEHARRAGDVRQERRAAADYAMSVALGPTLVDEAIDRCEEAIEQMGGDRQSEGIVVTVLAGLYAMQGEFDHARSLAERARELFAEMELEMPIARLGMEIGSIERLAGDLVASARELRAAYEVLDARGETYVLSTVAALLAQTLLEQGDLEGATVVCDRSRELTTEADIATEGLWRCVQGRILTRQGAYAEAEEITREALAYLEPTDVIVYQIECNVALGEVFAASGRIEEARNALVTARRLAETKGGVVILSGVLRRLEDLDAAQATS